MAVRLAIFQADSAGLDAGQRIERLREAARSARADVLLTPELYVSGYAVGDSLQRSAEAADGPMAARVAEIARETGTLIIYGYPEADAGQVFNAAQAIGPDGRRIANHRKLVLPPGFEGDHFQPGSCITLFEHAGLRFGLLVCYDAEFPEATRAVALAGAHCILVPTALGAEWDIVATRVIPARAFENGAYVAYANHAGREGKVTFLGGSCVVGPDGRDRARAGAEAGLITAEIDAASVEAARARLPYFRDLAGLRGRLGVTN